ncbi:HD-GYP domain-containing protein [Agrobacterium rubi]|uniref:HD domain-containing protein n=2 Tax=Agrobacterium rubi TaxID=28099 RepID=A0AAE7UM64_9HYPH|nr:HD-GYP domain-containing protein [Agrobacterium rubi]NTE87013.1 HD domain-containing protein [Agrobacterium rubi]QTF99617.1 HD domain-containing protein [Agrobacterium rubi]
MAVTRIDKSQLKIGMFVEAIEGAWQDIPTLGRRFTVRSGQEIEIIQNSNVSGIFINTALGRDTFGSSTHSGSRNITTATKQDKLKTARKVQGHAAEAKGLIEDVCQGRTLTVEAFTPLVNDVARTMEENPSLYIGMSRLRFRDSSTFVHSLAVAALLLHFGRSMQMDDEAVQQLCMAGILHDIGKLSIPIEVLYKQGPLNAAERRLVEQHPERGYELLSTQVNMPRLVLEICRSHHERLDGRGYPDKLIADHLSTEVRMSTICDVFDALTSARPYKKGWSSQQALSWMMSREDQFDKALLWHFILSLDPEMTKGIL